MHALLFTIYDLRFTIYAAAADQATARAIRRACTLPHPARIVEWSGATSKVCAETFGDLNIGTKSKLLRIFAEFNCNWVELSAGRDELDEVLKSDVAAQR